MSIKELRKIVVEIPFKDENTALVVYQSILPEVMDREAVRGRVKMKIRGNNVILIFYSRRTTIVRALWNSYIRWIMSIIKVLEVLNQ